MPSSKRKTAPSKAGSQKPRKARVPNDLAAQYGEKAKTKRAAPAPAAPARKPRRSAAEMAKRRELMAPPRELVARLATVEKKTAPVLPSEAPEPFNARRSRKWENRCGKCGSLNTFSVAAGLCPHCGAIAMRDQET